MTDKTTHNNRRSFLKTAAGTSLAALGGSALAQAFDFKPNQRYPDPSILILDPSFAKYRLYSSTVEQVGTGMRWAEGPVYFPAAVAGQAGYLLCRDDCSAASTQSPAVWCVPRRMAS
jgi:gluconolactonase